MAKGKRYNDKTRAAVISALLAGQGVNAVAGSYNLDPSTVSRWKKTIPKIDLQQVAIQKQASIAELMAENLRVMIDAQTQLAQRAATDESWFSSQSAEGIGTLIGILSDKTVRVIEIVQSVQQQQPVQIADYAISEADPVLEAGQS